MPIAKVHRISAAAPDDVSGIEAAIAAGRIDPKGVMAVLGKTEGNGLVNDFARGYAALALSLMFQRHLPADQAAKICLVMSGGTEGGMAPHWTVFERAEGDGPIGPALAIGRAHTPALPAEHLGRMPQVDMVAAAVRAAIGRCRHRQSRRRAFRPGQMPAADRAARRRSRGARRDGGDARHAEIDGPLARRQRARRRGGAGRDRARAPRRRARSEATGASGQAARAARPASSCSVTRSWCSACRRSGAGRSPSIMR